MGRTSKKEKQEKQEKSKVKEGDEKVWPSKEYQFSRNRLFYLILGFFIVTNLLVALGLSLFYLRAILSFIFIITIPGILIILIMKVRNLGFWEYVVYGVGLSISFMMFLGVAINWILPWINITDKPLQLKFILPIFDMFLLLMFYFAFKRNLDLKIIKFKIPFFNLLNKVFIIIPILFPILAILGALILNNHGPNYLTMILLAGIALYVLAIVIFRKKINPRIYPWAILMISVGIILSVSIRGFYLNGSDINTEFNIFRLIFDYQKWDLQEYSSSYNSLLSINILPTILNLFLGGSALSIFKIILPLIYALTPLIIYLFSKRFLNPLLSFLSAFFFMSQITFLKWWWIPIRQEVAFLFFGLSCLLFTSKFGNRKVRDILILIFGISLIVSHYSSTYIYFLVIILALALEFLFLKKRKETVRFIKISSLIILLIFCFLWYSQLTNLSKGFVSFSKESLTNLGDMFKEDVQAEGHGILDHFNFFDSGGATEILREYANQVNVTPGVNPSAFNYNIYWKSSPGTEKRLTYKWNNFILLFRRIFKLLIRLMILPGVVLWSFLLRDENSRRVRTLTISSFIVLVLLIILPFVSITYDLERTYFQLLFLLSPTVLIAITPLYRKYERVCICMAMILIIQFLLFSGITDQVLGGSGVESRLNNLGVEYDRHYTHVSESLSGSWLLDLEFKYTYISADKYELNKILDPRKLIMQGRINYNVLPKTFSENSYIYSGKTNKNKGITHKSYQGNVLTFNFPNRFLEDNRNKVYNNGGSEIFR
ncbi:DUF2206 domain-containing protein [Candidatus Pacearchaeota archaeon]|nr:DUF2206 domain-containing protein [Candidatus Pacearchaeota archaeon]